MRFNSAFKW